MTKFADIPWYILVEYLGTLESEIDPEKVSYSAYSSEGSMMLSPMGTFVTKGISQSLNLYAKNEDSSYKPLSFGIPYDWKQDNVIKLEYNMVYNTVESSTIKRIVSESGYYQETFDYLQDDEKGGGHNIGDVEPGDYIYSRKDSELNQWVIDNWEEYGGELNPHLTFLYLGEGYVNKDILEVHYYAMKDWVKDTLPDNNRTDNLDILLDTVFDKVYNKVYNRQKNIVNLIDPNEIEEDFFELVFNFYDEEPFVSLEEQFRVRSFLNNLIYLLKKRGTYSSLFVVWHILSEGTGNDLTVYDRWHEPTNSTLPLSAFEDFDYTTYYDTYDPNTASDYPEIYSLDNKILSTHYKLEFELNNNPFTDNYIITKNISNDLYRKWEEMRPVTRVPHYHELLYLESDVSGRSIPLYDEPKFDANLYSQSNIISEIGEGAYTHNQNIQSNVWNFTHDLDTRDLLIETYYLDDNIFKYIQPKEIKILSRNSVEIRFNDYVEGTALLLKADYNQDVGKDWIIHYNLESEQILYEVYDINNERVVPKEATITNAGNTLILSFEEDIPGRCIIKNIQNTELKYTHTQTEAASAWDVEHGLNYENPIYEVYNEDDVKIVPSEVYGTEGTLYLTFDEAVLGRCLVYIDITHTHVQDVESDYWDINHGLNSEDIFYEVYDGNDEIIYPETFDIEDNNNVLLTFSEPITGTCVLNKAASYEYERTNYIEHELGQKYPISQYYYFEEAEEASENWEIDYNLNSENIIFAVYDEYDYLMSPINAKVSSGGDTLTIFFDEVTYGKCVIKDANEIDSRHIHNQDSADNTWEINHGLGSSVLYEVYDSNGYKIFPESVTSEENTLTLEFSRSLTGRCVIVNEPQYEYNTVEPSNYWIITHDFGTKNIVFDVFNKEGENIYPASALTIDSDTLLLEFDDQIEGKCILYDQASFVYYNYEEGITQSLLRYFPVSNDEIIALNENELDVTLNSFDETETYRVETATVIPSAGIDDLGYGYVHTQTEAASAWTVEHNLGVIGVILDVYDSNDIKVIPTNIHLIDQNTCKVFLPQSISGTCSVRAVGTPKAGPLITNSFTGDFVVKFGYTEEDHNYQDDIDNPLSDFTTWCDQSNVTEKEKSLVISLRLPIGIEGYFNEVGVFDTEDNLVFYTTGDPVYKHNEMNIDFKFTINFENIE